MLLAFVLCAGSRVLAEPIRCDLGRYRPTSGLNARLDGDTLEVSWESGNGTSARLRFALDQGTPTIREIAVRSSASQWKVLAADVVPEFRITTGLRRVTNQQLKPLTQLGVDITPAVVDEVKWEAFWDAPLQIPPGAQGATTVPPRDGIAGQPGLPRRAEEIVRATAQYHVERCEVRTNGARLEVAFPGVDLGVFAGALQFTVYRGVGLIRQELIASTTSPSVAYKYDAGLNGLTIDPSSRVVWRDVANNLQEYRFGGARNDDAVPLTAANRLVAIERAGGSITAFPPPHNFFWAREIATNLGYTWYRKNNDTTFAFGVRQAEREADPGTAGRGDADYRENFALYSARPGTLQRMAVYFTVSADAAAMSAALAFTRNDRYSPLPGYKVFASHFHDYLVRRATAAGSLDAMPSDIEALKAAGVDIFGPIDGGAGGAGGASAPPSPAQYVENLRRYYEIARRFSDTSFTIMPNVEITDGELPVLMEQLGGHWDVLMSHPVLWASGRAAGQPLVTTESGHPVYHIGDANDFMEMIHRENLLVFMPHPRSKGSTYYPDAIKDTPRFRDDSFRGIGFRWGMGLDRSEQRLCEHRCLAVFDDMNNWAADLPTPKFVEAISEFYTQAPGDDIYANNPVNYVKLDRAPGLDDWAPIVDAMKRGDYFVTSGEVLIPEYAVEGTGHTRTVVANVEWTFPLEMVEIVWGDGTRTGRQVIPATDLPAFGSHRFRIPFDATGKKWVRFAAWDSAGNGAVVQPVRLSR
jgi:hypothetical protein